MRTIYSTVFSDVARPAPAVSLPRTSAETWRLVLYVLLGVGAALRLFHFFDNRSLWIDEVYVALSLLRMDFGQLARPALLYEQKAPILFLWLCRVAVAAFGEREMALRLVPLLSGLAGLLLFVPVARALLRPLGAAVAVGALALAPPLIYHSVEIKQYSTELLATVLALWLFVRYRHRSDWAALVAWGLAGAALVWLSYAVIFVLVATAGAVSLTYARRRNWPQLLRCALPFGLWAVSFGANYLLFTGKYTESGWLVYWFETLGAFLPAPTSWAALKWPFYQLYLALDYPLGLLLDQHTLGGALPRLLLRVVPLTCFAAGLWAFFRRDRQVLLLLIFAVLLTMLASGLEKYPFYERLIVFLAPVFILFIAGGCDYLSRWLGGDRAGRRRWVSVVLPGLLLLPPLLASARQAADPDLFGGYKKSYFREGFQHIDADYRAGDVVYLYWDMTPPYLYYKQAYGLQYNAVEGRDFRLTANSMPAYIDRTAADFEAAVGPHRGWLICDDLFKGKIGDFTGRPAWYYQESDVSLFRKLHRRITARTGRRHQDVFRRRTVHACLLAPAGQ